MVFFLSRGGGLIVGLRAVFIGLRLFTFPGNGLEALKLIMEAVPVAQCPGCVYQGCENAMFAGRVMMGT
jgi:Na+-translocating ferredoxin:NAD+ oxidoreductase RNF subunit RnfB